MHSNATMVKIVKTGKLLDVTKPQYRQDRLKHDWTREITEKRKEQ